MILFAVDLLGAQKKIELTEFIKIFINETEQ